MLSILPHWWFFPERIVGNSCIHCRYFSSSPFSFSWNHSFDFQYPCSPIFLFPECIVWGFCTFFRSFSSSSLSFSWAHSFDFQYQSSPNFLFPECIFLEFLHPLPLFSSPLSFSSAHSFEFQYRCSPVFLFPECINWSSCTHFRYFSSSPMSCSWAHSFNFLYFWLLIFLPAMCSLWIHSYEILKPPYLVFFYPVLPPQTMSAIFFPLPIPFFWNHSFDFLHLRSLVFRHLCLFSWTHSFEFLQPWLSISLNNVFSLWTIVFIFESICFSFCFTYAFSWICSFKHLNLWLQIFPLPLDFFLKP